MVEEARARRFAKKIAANFGWVSYLFFVSIIDVTIVIIKQINADAIESIWSIPIKITTFQLRKADSLTISRNSSVIDIN